MRLAFHLAALACTVVRSTTTTNGGGNVLPTKFPVSQFPVTTQTHFDSPSCPQGASSATQSLTINYNSVERTDPTTALTEIGVYNLLNFKNINHVNTDHDLDGNHLGLAPYTYPNAAAFAVGSPSITVDYIESTIMSFTPKYFWYGCVLPSPYTAGSLLVTCTITAKGLNAAGATTATQDFDFAKNGSVIQDQNQGVFHSGFKSVHSLNFSVDKPLSNAALVDNFVATLEQEACAPLYKGSYNNGS